MSDIKEMPQMNNEAETTPKNPEKKYSGIEALNNATNLNELLQAYQEEEKHSNLLGLVNAQKAMAENLMRLGFHKEALDFTLLAGQTQNNLNLQQGVEHLDHIFSNQLSFNITRLVEGLEAQINRISRQNNY